jgi:hypothetical protein
VVRCAYKEIAPEGATETTDRVKALDLCYRPDEDLDDRLEFSLENLELLRDWRERFNHLAGEWEAEVEKMITIGPGPPYRISR